MKLRLVMRAIVLALALTSLSAAVTPGPVLAADVGGCCALAMPR